MKHWGVGLSHSECIAKGLALRVLLFPFWDQSGNVECKRPAGFEEHMVFNHCERVFVLSANLCNQRIRPTRANETTINLEVLRTRVDQLFSTMSTRCCQVFVAHSRALLVLLPQTTDEESLVVLHDSDCYSCVCVAWLGQWLCSELKEPDVTLPDWELSTFGSQSAVQSLEVSTSKHTSFLSRDPRALCFQTYFIKICNILRSRSCVWPARNRLSQLKLLSDSVRAQELQVHSHEVSKNTPALGKAQRDSFFLVQKVAWFVTFQHVFCRYPLNNQARESTEKELSSCFLEGRFYSTRNPEETPVNKYHSQNNCSDCFFSA